MTSMEAKSIETTLIKISVKTLWAIIAAVVFSAVMGTMLYNNLMIGQLQILNEVRNNSRDSQRDIKDLRKDVSGLQEDMKVVKNTVK